MTDKHDMDKIIAFEEGTIEDQALCELFQGLVDDGSAWTLQGFYGRTACQLIAMGHIEVKDPAAIPPMARAHIDAIRKAARNRFDNIMRER